MMQPDQTKPVTDTEEKSSFLLSAHKYSLAVQRSDSPKSSRVSHKMCFTATLLGNDSSTNPSLGTLKQLDRAKRMLLQEQCVKRLSAPKAGSHDNEVSSRVDKVGSHLCSPVNPRQDTEQTSSVEDRKRKLRIVNSKSLAEMFADIPQTPSYPMYMAYHKCLDVDRQIEERQFLMTRIFTHPIDRATDKYESDKLQEEEELKKRYRSQPTKEISLAGNISEIFEGFESDTRKPWLEGSCQKDENTEERRFRKPQGIYALKGVALTDCQELAGKESRLLKRLLRTMRVKTWDPELYFRMNFFKMRHRLPPMSPEKTQLVRARWRWLVRMLKTLARIDRILWERSYEMSAQYRAYLDITDASAIPLKYECGLDVGSLSKRGPGVILSIDAQETLRDTPPEERTEEDIDQVVTSLQYVDDFAKMAPEIQRRIAFGAFLHDLRSKRVVVRQGHIPQYIYFVLSGQAVAKQIYPSKVRGGPDLVRTTGVVRKGMCFGLEDMLNCRRRDSTVVTRTEVNLMAVSKEVLVDTVLDPTTLDPLDDPILFLSKMWFMKGWPMERLIKFPHQCRIRCYRRTATIEKDTALSEWIYVVKSGSVKLFEELGRRRSTYVPPVYKFPRRPVTRPSRATVSSPSSQGLPTSSSARTRSVSVSLTRSLEKPEKPTQHGKLSVVPQGIVAEIDVRSAVDANSSDVVKRMSERHLSLRKMSAEHRRKAYEIPEKCKPQLDTRPDKPQEPTYSLVRTLRRYDVSGLEDIVLDPKMPPRRAHFIMLSDQAEVVMLKKAFFLQFANKSLRERVLEKLRNPAHKPLTCDLITIGKLLPDRKGWQCPLSPEDFCVHL